MKNQKQLTDYLIQSNRLKKSHLINAFYKIDRIDFINPAYKENAYNDEALPIGHGQTISQPTVVAFMLELLDPKKSEKILDIGCGSGWTTALIAECVKPTGTVTGIEIIPELVEFGKNNLAKYNFKNSEIIQAGKEALGLPDEPAFDKILVSAAAKTLPEELISQFTKRLVIPIENSIWLVEKGLLGKLKKTEYFGFSFVPLV